MAEGPTQRIAGSQRILLTQAGSGMRLAEAVTAQPGGMPICSAGTTLDDELLHRLTMRGIKRIVVEGHPVPGFAEQPFAERLADLERRFAPCARSPLMQAVKEAIINHWARR